MEYRASLASGYVPCLRREKVTKHVRYLPITGGVCTSCSQTFNGEGYTLTTTTLIGSRVLGMERRDVDKRCKEAAFDAQ